MVFIHTPRTDYCTVLELKSRRLHDGAGGRRARARPAAGTTDETGRGATPTARLRVCGVWLFRFWAGVPHRNRDHRAYGAVRHLHLFLPYHDVTDARIFTNTFWRKWFIIENEPTVPQSRHTHTCGSEKPTQRKVPAHFLFFIFLLYGFICNTASCCTRIPYRVPPPPPPPRRPRLRHTRAPARAEQTSSTALVSATGERRPGTPPSVQS